MSEETQNPVEKVAEKTPWWAISVGVHALIVLILTYVVVFARDYVDSSGVHVNPTPKDQPPPIFVPPTPKPPSDVHYTEKDLPLEFKNPTEDDVVEDDIKAELTGAAGESLENTSNAPFTGRNSNDAIGAGMNLGSDYGRPNAGGFKWRRPIGGRSSGEKKDPFILEALRWLARHQNPDGSWSVQGYVGRCNRPLPDGNTYGGGSCSPNPGHADFDTGVTGLSLLAFLGAGHSHLSREAHDGICFGNVVRNGMQFLIRSQGEDGCIGSRDDDKHMYNHAIAALALAEAYGLTGSDLPRAAAQKGIDFLIAAQNEGKGWRYSFKCGDNDTSVTGWAVMALKSAELSGLDFPRKAYDGARAWLDEVTDESYYRAGYTYRGTGKVFVPGMNEQFNHHEALTAIAVMSRAFIDKNHGDPRLRGGCELLVRDLPRWEEIDTDFYYWYYASLALFQFDGFDGRKYWNRWDAAMNEALMKNQILPRTPEQRASQCRHGSWEPVGRWCGEGGRVYATAINTLTYEVHNRYHNVFVGLRK